MKIIIETKDIDILTAMKCIESCNMEEKKECIFAFTHPFTKEKIIVDKRINKESIKYMVFKEML